MESTLTIRRLKDIRKSVVPDILYLMETKNEDDFVLKNLKSLDYPYMFTVPHIGLSSGLVLLWKEGVKVAIKEFSPNFIDSTVTFKNVSSTVNFIYGAP